jgi:histidinol-phosphate/aromatic aminotransferase/cobyric acid decarboxylase-like protein
VSRVPLVPPHVASLQPYVPGKPIEEVEREYGVSDVAKLASNENALASALTSTPMAAPST